jgi:hypothetical protein
MFRRGSYFGGKIYINVERAYMRGMQCNVGFDKPLKHEVCLNII